METPVPSKNSVPIESIDVIRSKPVGCPLFYVDLLWALVFFPAKLGTHPCCPSAGFNTVTTAVSGNYNGSEVNRLCAR